MRGVYELYKRHAGENDLSAPMYAALHRRLGKNAARLEWPRIEGHIPEDLLRSYLVRLTQGPEGFIAVRQNLARSLSVANTAGYVLGIGDRHLQNILLCTRDGSVVHIDFGYSFGFSTFQLAVPELVPMRLTRQFEALLRPLDSRQLTFQTMCHTMGALRDGKESLLAVMEIFLNEPLLDWTASSAAKHDNAGAMEVDEQDEQDVARQAQAAAQARLAAADPRVERVRLKLQGAHPVAIMANEINARQFPVQGFDFHDNNTAYIETLKAALDPLPTEDAALVARRHSALCTDLPLGDPRWDSQSLDVAAQVHTLIRMATEPTILSKTWAGWQPWL
jgi:DNA-dependent protein kinase catalytic subunit